jgi:Tfp pilus assembly protein PilX
MLLRMRRDERGFTMVTVIGALLAVTLLSVAALSYAQGDLKPGAHDRDRKIAYAAAEAGIQNYEYYLSQDASFWAKCDADTASYSTPAQINQRWDGRGTDPRTWTPVPGSTSSYTIELLPANGESSCDVDNAEATMIDATTGTFRVRATGRALVNGVKRSIVANFKRRSLLDFIYFTDKETRSPLLYDVEIGERNTRNGAGKTIAEWAMANCDRYHGDDTDGGRQLQHYDGEYEKSLGHWQPLDTRCTDINFVDGDVTAGPVHTNDELFCIGAPVFGMQGQVPPDPVETSSSGQTANPAAGYNDAGCSPNIIGIHIANAAKLDIPPTNLSLRRDTAADYRFVGRTQIKLNGANMTVTGMRENGTQLTNAPVALPADGVIYVSNSKRSVPPGSPGYSCPGYDVTAPTQTVLHNACGNLEISGNYGVNLTLTAENDILVMGDIVRPAGTPPSPDVLLGLIANNFIRVNHPVTGCPVYGCNLTTACTTLPATLAAPHVTQIDAAILSLKQSFIADNWHCGGALGNLTVRGAIIQKYRGAVGHVASATGAWSGYDKDYSYDSRLRYRSPPKFLDPVQASWRIQTYNEQVPAR